MSDKSAADFLHDQLEALLASPALARHADPCDEPAASEQPILEGDTQPSVDVQNASRRAAGGIEMTSEAKTRASDGSLMPSTREHGVWGTKSDPVGGFGEGYSAQIAHGSEPNLAEDAEEAAEDAPLGREVRKTLARAHVDAADLRVAVRGGHVTLLGSVRNDLEKAQIEARARAIPGVADVTNRLNVLNNEGDGLS